MWRWGSFWGIWWEQDWGQKALNEWCWDSQFVSSEIETAAAVCFICKPLWGRLLYNTLISFQASY